MRRRRIVVENGKYHVIARANRGEFILESPSVKQLFLSVLKRAKSRFKFAINSICIMDNHVHLVIQPLEGASLSRIMQWVLSVFAMQFNRRHGLHGHVWYDRFKSTAIRSYRQFLRTLTYIRDNPERAGISQAGADYKFGTKSIRRSLFRSLLGPPH